EWDRAARSADRLLKLAPEQDDALRDRGLAYLQLDYQAGARQDLALYLQRNGQANDAQWVREKLVEMGGRVPRLH
ncbi:tetratricopeptide repeat protein, partial [Mycobacterium tuberculosis]|nr:tetratricopeptide repeat protein [Mycobacterium tuberculosis]